MALFVFGAGATRGCSFVDASRHPCLPPLDSDFFTQVQRIQSSKHTKLVEDVLNDTIELFGKNFEITMEMVFTTLEHTITMIETSGQTRAFTKKQLTAKRNRLLQILAAVLEDSLTRAKSSGRASLDPEECDYHSNFVSNILNIGDAIISFNYDCVLDYALRNHGSGKWNARYGYALDLGSKGSHLTGDPHWNPVNPAKKSDSIKNYKLHGSLHFDIGPKKKPGYIKLKQRPYTKQRGSMKYTIIPPEWNKKYNEEPFSVLWKKAAAALKSTKQLILIGYSMPPTDLHSGALFRTSIGKEALKSLVVVNPDQNARKRIRGQLQRAISKSTKVISFDYFSEFLSCRREVWDI
ncbi:MAG: SIR2 family protein [Spirochaetales bacterium]|nr:SIR2 family protein [Spirochaetales bacterium]